MRTRVCCLLVAVATATTNFRIEAERSAFSGLVTNVQVGGQPVRVGLDFSRKTSFLHSPEICPAFVGPCYDMPFALRPHRWVSPQPWSPPPRWTRTAVFVFPRFVAASRSSTWPPVRTSSTETASSRGSTRLGAPVPAAAEHYGGPILNSFLVILSSHLSFHLGCVTLVLA